MCVCVFVSGSKVKKTFSLFICFRIGFRRNLVWVETKVQKNIDCFLVQMSKKHYLCLSVFVLDVEETWSGLRRKLKKTSISSGFKGQKNIFFAYSLDCREGHMKKNSLCVCVCVRVKGHFIKFSIVKI